MLKHVLWFIAGVAAVSAGYILWIGIYMATGFPTTLEWGLVASVSPLLVGAIISIFVWKKSRAFAAAVALLVVWQLIGFMIGK